MDRTEQEEYIFGGILLLANKFQIWGDGLLDEITLKQWFLILLISKMDSQYPTVKEVADFTGTTRQNIKKMLEHLEIQGFVSLSRSKTDARAWNVGLTPKSFEYFVSNAQKGADAVNTLFSQVSDNELESAAATVKKLLFALEETGK